MCGRYYIDDDTAREIEKLVKQIDDKLWRSVYGQDGISGKDIFPGSFAPVITSSGGGLEVSVKQWGFPGFEKNKLIFNARAESVLEKKMFKDSMLLRRCIIPAAHFYEWNKRKEKFTFRGIAEPTLYMAGFYKKFEGGDRFVILTTKANTSMTPVHDRMPLLLEKAELQPFMGEEMQAEKFLKKVPEALERQTDYQQQSMPFLI